MSYSVLGIHTRFPTLKEISAKVGLVHPESWVAVALRATMESESVSSIHRRTECDGYPWHLRDISGTLGFNKP